MILEVFSNLWFWHCPMLHTAVSFPILQEGSAAAQSNPCAYDLLVLIEASYQPIAPLSPSTGRAPELLSTFPKKGGASSPTSICSSMLWLWFLLALKEALTKLYGQEKESSMGFGKRNNSGTQEPSHSSHGKAISLQDFSGRLDLLSFFLFTIIVSFPDHGERWVLESYSVT